MTINDYMTGDHRACDEIFTKVENIVADGKIAEAKDEFGEFYSAMIHHFEMEERVIFPEFNEKNVSGCNPTGVMIMEHEQMKQLMGKMLEAVESEDSDKFLSISETFMMLLQQHNMKEEQMMYNMADEVLDSQDIIEKIKEI